MSRGTSCLSSWMLQRNGGQGGRRSHKIMSAAWGCQSTAEVLREPVSMGGSGGGPGGDGDPGVSGEAAACEGCGRAVQALVCCWLRSFAWAVTLWVDSFLFIFKF